MACRAARYLLPSNQPHVGTPFIGLSIYTVMSGKDLDDNLLFVRQREGYDATCFERREAKGGWIPATYPPTSRYNPSITSTYAPEYFEEYVQRCVQNADGAS